MKIAIAGAGIGGLAAASLLHDAGHKVTIFDQFKTPKPIGSGLVIQPVGQQVLDQIGVLETAMQRGAPVRSMLGHESKRGWRTLDVKYDMIGDGACGLSMHRGGLFETLLEATKARNIPLVSNFKVTGHKDKQLIAGDTTHPEKFHLIVDALGVHSTLSPIKVRPLGFGAVWDVVDWPKGSPLPRDQLTQRYRAARNMIGVMPCGAIDGREKAAIFWSLPTDSYQDFVRDGLHAWQKEASDIWPEFAPFAGEIQDIKDLTFAQYAHGTLWKPWSSGLVHIGDSAHQASPQLGQGANMAMLDAAALTFALETHSGDAALRKYTSLRRPHIMLYQMMSALFTAPYQSHSKVLPWLRDWVMFPISRIPPIPRFLTHLVRGDVFPPVRGGKSFFRK